MDTSYSVPGHPGPNLLALPQQSQIFQAGVPRTAVADQDDRQLSSFHTYSVVPQSNLASQSTPSHLGHGYPTVSTQPPGNHTSTDIHHEFASTELQFLHQARYGMEASETHALAPGTTSIEPHGSPQFVFQTEPQKQPVLESISDEAARAQKEEARARKEKLRAIGGACVWCCQNKRACDPQTVCDNCTKKNVPCLRGHQQLWLYRNTPNYSSQPSTHSEFRFPNLMQAKRQTFEHVNVLLFKLRSQVLDRNLVSQGFLQLRWRFHGDSGTMTLEFKNLKKQLQDYSVTQEEVDVLADLASRLVSFPDLSTDSESTDGSLISFPLKMVKLVGFLLTLRRAEVFGRLADRAAARLALVHLITHIAMALSQFSAKFSAELVGKLRLRKNNGVMRREIFVATGLYSRCVHTLGMLKQGSLIAEILSGMTTQLESVEGLITQLLRTGYLAQSTIDTVVSKEDFSKLKDQRFKNDFEKYVPSAGAIAFTQIAFYPFDENTAHNFQPFGSCTLMTVSELLTDRVQPPSIPQTLPAAPMTAEPREPAVEDADPLYWFDCERFARDLQEGEVVVGEGEKGAGDEDGENRV